MIIRSFLFGQIYTMSIFLREEESFLDGILFRETKYRDMTLNHDYPLDNTVSNRAGSA